MNARIMLAACAVALALGGVALAAAPPPATTVKIAMPAEDSAFKPGAGVELVRRDCLTCHASAYITTQPPLSRAQWTAEVTKMRAVYGAAVVIPEADIPALVDYLTAQYGRPTP